MMELRDISIQNGGHMMEEQKCREVGYYRIRKCHFWIGIVFVLVFVGSLSLKIGLTVKQIDTTESAKNMCTAEYGHMDSKLKNKDECYLCGYSEHSLMSYYRKFDTLGVIGLNEWYVLDLGLKKYDEEGNKSTESDTTSMMSGTTQGVHYYVNATPSRGMSSAMVVSEEIFNPKVIRENLCQECLDKVLETLKVQYPEGEVAEYKPFVLVNFDTLELYSLQEGYSGISIGDYWVELEYNDEGEIMIDAYYTPIKE